MAAAMVPAVCKRHSRQAARAKWRKLKIYRSSEERRTFRPFIKRHGTCAYAQPCRTQRAGHAIPLAALRRAKPAQRQQHAMPATPCRRQNAAVVDDVTDATREAPAARYTDTRGCPPRQQRYSAQVAKREESACHEQTSSGHAHQRRRQRIWQRIRLRRATRHVHTARIVFAARQAQVSARSRRAAQRARVAIPAGRHDFVALAQRKKYARCRM